MSNSTPGGPQFLLDSTVLLAPVVHFSQGCPILTE
uniref:Uncharacterized protein n=1 Tax=Anguilla anguilla TaxID=7936 RepID=A0A0E9UCS5_ANGAN